MSKSSGLTGQIIRYGFDKVVVRRATYMAIVVGSILVFINHGERIFAGDFSFTLLWQSLLTLVVPYCVSTFSSVLAMIEHADSP